MDGIAVDTQITVALGIPSHPKTEIAFGSAVSCLVSEYRRRAPVNKANNDVIIVRIGMHKTPENWRPQGDSNPCCRRERAVS